MSWAKIKPVVKYVPKSQSWCCPERNIFFETLRMICLIKKLLIPKGTVDLKEQQTLSEQQEIFNKTGLDL